MSDTFGSLLEKMDEYAMKLLQEAFEGNGESTKTGESEGTAPPKLTIRDKTAVFQAVQTYLTSREKKRPGAKGQTKVDEYRDRINGRTARGGRGTAVSSEAQNSGADAAA